MSNSFRITEYPIKILRVTHGELTGISHLQTHTKVDYGFADINTTDGPCTMFRVPITTTIIGQNGMVAFHLETRNNFDIYGFRDNPDISTLESCINQSFVAHNQICQHDIAATPFAAMSLSSMDEQGLQTKLHLDLQRLYKR